MFRFSIFGFISFCISLCCNAQQLPEEFGQKIADALISQDENVYFELLASDAAFEGMASQSAIVYSAKPEIDTLKSILRTQFRNEFEQAMAAAAEKELDLKKLEFVRVEVTEEEMRLINPYRLVKLNLKLENQDFEGVFSLILYGKEWVFMGLMNSSKLFEPVID